MNYLAFFRANARFLSFGLLLAGSASFGQTFFVSLYMGEVRAEFGLSHGDVGTIYSLATLASGMTMIWFGRLIDVVPLRPLAIAVTGGMIVSCLTMAWTPAAWALAIAFYLLRLCGQGLMSHTSITGTLRAFDTDRGKAVGVVSFGQPLGESALPLIAVALVAAFGWRSTWLLYAGFLAFLVIPVIYVLLAGKAGAMGAHAARGTARHAGRQWSRREMLRDSRFHLMLPALLAPSYVSTGLIFHQAHLAEARAMVGHGHAFGDAASVIQWHIVGMFGPSFFTGHLIRRFGVLRIMLAGAAFLFVAIASGAAGTGFANYWTGLFCLGLGWNFLFIGGTTLLTETHTEAEKAKVQGLNDFLVFGTVSVASLSAGTLLHLHGWQTVNLGALPFIVLTSMAIVWLALRRRHAARHELAGG